MLFDLLERGYFPRELPPSFSTGDFARFTTHSAFTLPIGLKSSLRTRCCAHSLARHGALRRALGVPNPWSQFFLAIEVTQSWLVLKALLHRRSRVGLPVFSASRPVYWKNQSRALIPRYAHSELPFLQVRARVGARYAVRTDIANFYPTVYTHSIPWAIHSKPVAKANRSNTLLGNRLDQLARNQYDGQTVGIPVGPDTSLLLAECVLRGVDDIMASRLPKHVGFRHVDDYEIACSSLSEAEEALAALEGTLAEFQLTLNPRKTRFEELPAPMESRWVSDLAGFVFVGITPRRERSELSRYFSMAYELAAVHPDDSVLKYAITRLRTHPIATADGWSVTQDALLNCAQGQPESLPVVFAVLSRNLAGGWLVNKKSLGLALTRIVARHAPVGHGSEVAWALWGAIAFDVSLDLDAVAMNALASMEDDFVALLAMDAEKRHLLPLPLNLQKWAGFVRDEFLDSEHWLLAYEADAQGWISRPASQARNTAITGGFRALAVAGVKFYDHTKNVPSTPSAALRIPGGSVGLLEGTDTGRGGGGDYSI